MVVLSISTRQPLVFLIGKGIKRSEIDDRYEKIMRIALGLWLTVAALNI
jgi:hypothetical protein